MILSKYWNDYKRNRKDFFLEEPFDFLLFRPVAYMVVKGTYSLPLTPNHFSLLGLIVALLSGYSLSQGTRASFFWGGIGILIFSVFDCCDGMLARMKSNGSKHGDLIDMFVDVLSSISFYSGLTVGLLHYEESLLFPLFSGLSVFLILFHAILYNFYKSQYLAYLEGSTFGKKREVASYENELRELKEAGKKFDAFLVGLIIVLTKLQKRKKNSVIYNKESYLSSNRKTLPLWGAIAGSSHLTVLAFSLLFNIIGFYFFCSIILFNIILFFATLLQFKINNENEVAP